jgi:hypothetical protein
MAAAPYLGFGLTLVILFLYLVLFARHVFSIRLDKNQPSLPSSPMLSPLVQQLQQNIVNNFEHRLFYRDDEALTTQQSRLNRLFKLAPTHRDLLLNQTILSEVKPELAPAELSSTSAYQRAQYSDPNFPLLNE